VCCAAGTTTNRLCWQRSWTARPPWCWPLRLEQFLRDNPEAAEAIRELTERLAAELPRPQQQWVQNNEAHDNSQVFGVQNGNVIIHQAPGSGSRPPGSGRQEPGPGRGGPMT